MKENSGKSFKKISNNIKQKSDKKSSSKQKESKKNKPCSKQNCASHCESKNSLELNKTQNKKYNSLKNEFNGKEILRNSIHRQKSAYKNNKTKGIKQPKENPSNEKKNNSFTKDNQSIEVTFNYKNKVYNIQSYLDETMENIIERFVEESKINILNKSFLYNEQEIDNKKLLGKIAKGLDIKGKKINISVQDSEDKNKSEEIISNELICPECFDNIILTLDNYKVNYKCSNNHFKKQMDIKEYECFQKINLSKIKCGSCKKITKYLTNNNEFYFCNICKVNLCPSCKSNHIETQNHSIVNYDEKQYICRKHNEKFINYCEECQQNICFSCKEEHKTHKGLIDLHNMILDKDEITKEFITKRKIYDEIKNVIEDIILKLTDLIKNLDTFYKINTNIIENYDPTKRNYQIFQNIKEITQFNDTLYRDLTSIKKEKSFSNKIGKIIEIYNKINVENYEIIYPNGDKYIGEMKDNLRNGKGKMLFNDNDKRHSYEGEWKNDLFDGKGKLTWKSGNYYNGDWKQGIKEGKGIFCIKPVETYNGDWKNDKKEGKGIIYFSNGNIYEGDWKNDEIEGKGIMFFEDGERFEGEIKDNLKTGILYKKNGDKCIGKFEDNLLEGKGVIFHPNDEIEMAIFSKGDRKGKKYAIIDLKNNIETKKI